MKELSESFTNSNGADLRTWESFANKIVHWTGHSITTIYVKDTSNVILQSFKSFQLQTFLFFLIV